MNEMNKMNKNILHTRKTTVFVDFYERVNYVFMILCFGRVISCVERLDTYGFKFSAKLKHSVHREFSGSVQKYKSQ